MAFPGLLMHSVLFLNSLKVLDKCVQGPFAIKLVMT